MHVSARFVEEVASAERVEKLLLLHLALPLAGRSEPEDVNRVGLRSTSSALEHPSSRTPGHVWPGAAVDLSGV